MTLSNIYVLQRAVFNPKTSIFIQRRHPYTENLNSQKSGDSQNTFLHCGDVVELAELRAACMQAGVVAAYLGWFGCPPWLCCLALVC